MKHSKKILRGAAIFAGVIVFLVVAFSFWFYFSPPSNFKLNLGRAVPILPAAFVDGRIVLVRDTLSLPIEKVIAEKKTEIIADKFGVSLTAGQVEAQLNQMKQQPDFNELLIQYAISENNFKNYVLKPELLYTNVELWFNSQRSLNSSEYSLADNIVQQINQPAASASVDSLVGQYSQDSATKALDGNLGFVSVNSLWPEFQSALESAKVGQAVEAPGRDGLYIFYIKAKDNNGPEKSPRAEIQEIYLKTEDFNSWYNNEINKINTKILI